MRDNVERIAEEERVRGIFADKKPHVEREHLTDGTPCWCDPTVENYEQETKATNIPDRDEIATKQATVDAITANDATSGADPWDSRESYPRGRSPR